MEKLMKMRFPKLYDFRLKLYMHVMRLKDLHEKIIDHIHISDKQILDIYCKTGLMTIKIAKERPHSHVIGMENNFHFLRLAKRKKRQNFVKNIDFMNLSNLDLEEKNFDLITICFTLSQLSMESLEELIKKVKSLLKNNKRLLIVDYSNGNNSLTNFFMKIYSKLFLHQSIEIYSKVNYIDILERNGYGDIKLEELNGVKIIQSVNHS